jgi:hypothetical protein
MNGKIKKLVRDLKRKAKTRGWRDIAKQDYGNRVHFSVLNKIANTGGAYTPSDEKTRIILGLYRKPRRLTPKTIHNDDRGQSWTLYMRHLIKGMATPTPTQLTKKRGKQ